MESCVVRVCARVFRTTLAPATSKTCTGRRFTSTCVARAVLVEQGLLLLHELQVVGLETGLGQRLVGRAEAVRIPTAVIELDCKHDLGLASSLPHGARFEGRQVGPFHAVVGVRGVDVLA